VERLFQRLDRDCRKQDAVITDLISGRFLKLFEDGKLAASVQCKAMIASDSDTIWFGTDGDSNRVWDGRIDELALFDRALTEVEVAALFRTAQEEIFRLR
jgi:hypothetical protein